jgi:hypothetical protein
MTVKAEALYITNKVLIEDAVDQNKNIRPRAFEPPEAVEQIANRRARFASSYDRGRWHYIMLRIRPRTKRRPKTFIAACVLTTAANARIDQTAFFDPKRLGFIGRARFKKFGIKPVKTPHFDQENPSPPRSICSA